MKVLVVNRNFFVTGGPEKYMFSLMRNMPEHEFIPFCLNFTKNEKTVYEKYFLQPPGSPENVYFNQFEMSKLQKISYGLNMIYSFSARRQLETLINETKPDVALFLNAVYFTDSIIDACRKHDVPIIWRLSDFNKICANYLLYRDGNTCEECIEKGLWCILKNQCGGYQRSLSAAIIKTISMYLSKIRNTNDYINFFVTPSQFTKEKMVKGGFNKDRIVHIPTFIKVDESDVRESRLDEKKILYVGRLSPEKGVEVLIDAFNLVKDKDAVLTIVGDVNSSYAEYLIAKVPEKIKSKIEFLGFKNYEEVKILYQQSLFLIVPSVWFENQPNVVLEGMACERPVLVSKLGSLTEMVSNGETGYHFKADNSEDLAEKIDSLLKNLEKTIEMGKKARRYVEDQHSLQNHLSSLNKLFYQVVKKNKDSY